MANFDATTRTKINSVTDAAVIVQSIQAAYRASKAARDFIILYNSNTNPTFNAAVNAIYTASERSELGAVLTQLNALVNDLETNHAALLSV